ncbi:hypothetical protein [Cyclobacterium marinum]|nr:hypothetical protein [Cyclobacterium marinum]
MIEYKKEGLANSWVEAYSRQGSRFLLFWHHTQSSDGLILM